MKKIKILGIATIAVLLLSLIGFTVLSLLGILSFEETLDGKREIIFTPAGEKNSGPEWQTSETEGDTKAVIKTSLGDIGIKLGNCAAAEKFVELCEKGAFDDSGFSVLADGMFIQTFGEGEDFEIEENGYGCFFGAVGFVLDEKTASPSFFIITAEELSAPSVGFINESGFDPERAEFYKNFGGIPEYEGKTVIFGQVVSGMETVMKIAEKEDSGYVGGYEALEPEKIESIKILYSES